MAHTYDTNKNTIARGRSASGRDITITTPSGSTVIVLVICVGSTTARTGGAPTVTSGGAGTFSQADQVRNDGSETNTELWYLLAPPIGALTVHIPDDNNMYFSADIASFSAGSGKSSALRTANGTTGSSINPAAPQLTGLGTGDVLVGISSDGDSNYAPTGQTGVQLYAVDDGLYGHASQYYITPNSNNVTMSWTFGNSSTWTAIVAAFREVIAPVSLSAGLPSTGKAATLPKVIEVSGFQPVGVKVALSKKPLVGAFTSAAAVATEWIKGVIQQALEAGIAFVGQSLTFTQKVCAGAATSAGMLVKSSGKVVVGAWASTAVITNKFVKSVAGLIRWVTEE